jgi:hypothetical protein
MVTELEEVPMSIVGGLDVRHEALVFRMGCETAIALLS